MAFDGTVTAIAPAQLRRPGGVRDVVSTTFTVHEWFRGGSAATVTVDLPTGFSSVEPPLRFVVGTRLLVSGTTRSDTFPDADVRALSCGFTRYHDEATASAWRFAFG